MTKRMMIDAVSNLDDKLLEKHFKAKEALKVKKGNKSMWVKIGALAACLCFVITASIIAIPLIQRSIAPTTNPGVQTPQYIYQVSEKVSTSYGALEYSGFENNTISFKIQSAKDWEYSFYIEAYKYESDTERIRYVATTNDDLEFGGAIILANALTIHIDGKEASNLFIPADGKTHDVTINYNYLCENGYDPEFSWSLNEFGRFTLKKQK